MQKIFPCLWFDSNAEEAVSFYTSIFPNSKKGTVAYYDEASSVPSGKPAGSVMTVEYTLNGEPFLALNGGPIFKFTPAVSLFVECETEKQIDALWSKLSEGGTVMMPYQAWPFSKKFGWVADRFGVSWQLNLVDKPLKISPCLMFVQDKSGKAEEAMNFYVSLFKNSSIDLVSRYEEGEHDTVGFIKHAAFTLDGVSFKAMDSSADHKFTFSQATSFVVNCEDQAEVDHFWEKFSDGGQKQPCGWVIDKYGVAWQVTPTILGEMMADKDPEKAKRVMKAMLEMEKLDIAELKKAYEGE